MKRPHRELSSLSGAPYHLKRIKAAQVVRAERKAHLGKTKRILEAME